MKHERTNFTCPVCNKPFSIRKKYLVRFSAEDSENVRCSECIQKGYMTKEDKTRGTK